MVNLKKMIIFLLAVNSYAQSPDPEIEWMRHFPFIDSSGYGLSNYQRDQINNTVIDREGSIYIASNNTVPAPYYKEFRLTKFSSTGIYLWTRSYRDSVYNINEAGAVNLDDQGNIYAVVFAYTGTGYTSESDLILLKYDPAGNLLLKKRYTPPGLSYSFPIPGSVNLDKDKNIIIGGRAGYFNFDGDWNTDSILIIKFTPGGEELWTAETKPDTLTLLNHLEIEIDDSGNIYIGGNSYWYTPGKGHYDYLVIKYNTLGEILWYSIYDYNDYLERPLDFTIDSHSNIYITGYYQYPYSNANDYIWLTLKYDKNGNLKNSLFREITYGNYFEYGGIVKTDNNDNVYIAGRRYSNNRYYFAVDKYDNSGNFLWEKLFDLVFGSASQLLVNPNNNITIAGVDDSLIINIITLDQNGDIVRNNKFRDFAQGFQHPMNLTSDPAGNQYITLFRDTAPSNVYLFKYSPTGDMLWKTSTGDYGKHRLKKIKTDAEGNVYAAGVIDNDSSDFDYAVIKYDSSGNPLWGNRYQGPAGKEDIPEDMDIDSDGNVYVTGSSKGIGTGYDYATIKYDKSGERKWIARYNGPSFSSDEGKKIKVDPSGNVYVTGNSLNTNANYDIATIRYNSSGLLQWVKRFNGSANGMDAAADLELDPEGNLYIGGTSDSIGTLYDFLAIKYNSSGDELWRRRYNGPGNDGDVVTAIAVDDSANVFLTGWSVGSGTNIDFATVKYNASGQEQWAARWDDPASSSEEAYDIGVDNNGNVYVAGFSPGAGTADDYTVIKYNINGEQQWAIPYNWPADGSDIPSYLALDHTGDIYITGFINDESELGTVKFNGEGSMLWDKTFRYGNYDGVAAGLIVDNYGNIYVGGYSNNVSSSFWNIIKYSQPGFVPADVAEEIFPSEFSLYQNYPNPFNPVTNIEYRLPGNSLVQLKVYNLLGEEVAVLVNEISGPGIYKVRFDASSVSSGVYFYKIEVVPEEGSMFSQVRKMMVIK